MSKPEKKRTTKRKTAMPQPTPRQEDVVFDALIKRYTKQKDGKRLRWVLTIYHDVLCDRHG